MGLGEPEVEESHWDWLWREEELTGSFLLFLRVPECGEPSGYEWGDSMGRLRSSLPTPCTDQ